MKKTIGILGGMGPEATVYIYNTIIRKTRVRTDQDHIPIIIYADPRVPPRTDAIFGTGPDPTPLLVKGAKALEAAGADFILIPCITAHYFLPGVREAVDIPFLSLPEQAALWARKAVPGLERVGLLSSTGTLKSRIFHGFFEAAGMEILEPGEEEQTRVMDAIFGPEGIKAGYLTGASREGILEQAGRLVDRGAGAILAGCTEVPLVLHDPDIPVPLIEPMRIAAEAAVLEAGYELKDTNKETPS